MKQQVTRLSPHQNGKVFAVLMAATSLVFIVPILLIAAIAGPRGSAPPPFFIVLFPIFYLVVGYAMTAVGCAIYNLVVKYVGGIEFEVKGKLE